MASSRALTKEEKKRTAQKKIQVKASLAVCTYLEVPDAQTVQRTAFVLAYQLWL
jgi:hypothetical protein